MTLLPGATLDPGAHWNYQAGYSSCMMVVWHYTVGRDSRALIRDKGLAALLIWDAEIFEYAPLDAVCYTECEWNRRSIGYEVESIDGSITPGQVANLGYATLFALTTFGIQPVFYDGPRMPVGYDYRGVTNHRNLIHNACDMHSDGFDRAVWEAIFAPPPPPAPPAPTFALTGDDEMFATCIIPDQLYETFSITDAGTVEHWYHPRSVPDEHETIASDAKPGGKVTAVRVVKAGAWHDAGRCDVYYEKPDGTRGHVWQAGDSKWAWNVDPLPW